MNEKKKAMNGRFKQKVKVLAACAMMAPVITVAQDKVTADVGAEIVSGYIWRGQKLGNVSVQPSLSIGYKGFSLSGWGSVGLDKDDTREVDLTLGYAVNGFHVSVTDYWFSGGAGYFHYKPHNTTHVFEANVGYDFGFLTVNWFTNFAGSDGRTRDGSRAYSSYFAIAAPFRLGGLDWTAEVGAVPWATSFYNTDDGNRFGARSFEVSNVTLGASKAIRITDTYSLPLFARITWNPTTEGVYFVFGLSLF